MLTLLLMVGLFFFIRASIKDRTEQMEFIATEAEESVFERLQTYFEKRSYQIKNIDGKILSPHMSCLELYYCQFS